MARPEQERTASAPMLFLQGSRDAFGRPEEIRNILKQQKLRATIYPIEGGDHSFKTPKASGKSQQSVYVAAVDAIIEWLSKNAC
jgi:predicted alpha/beta-hydrolase family hydrolase